MYPINSLYQSHQWECIFLEPTQQRQRQGKKKSGNMEDRLSHLENLLRDRSAVSQTTTGLEDLGVDTVATLLPSSNIFVSQDNDSSSGFRGISSPKSVRKEFRRPSPSLSLAESSITLPTESIRSQSSHQFMPRGDQLPRPVVNPECSSYPLAWTTSNQATILDVERSVGSTVGELAEVTDQQGESRARGLPSQEEV